MPRKRKAPTNYQVVSIECDINGQIARYWLAIAAQIKNGRIHDVIVAHEPDINGEPGEPFTASSRAKALEYIKLAQLNTVIADKDSVIARLIAENNQLRGNTLSRAS